MFRTLLPFTILLFCLQTFGQDIPIPLAIRPTEAQSFDAIICNRTDMVNTNFGNNEYLQACGWTGYNVRSDDQDWRILLNFPAIDTLTGNNKITLTLFDAPSRYFIQEGSNASKIYLITSKWDENSVTWNTQPTYDASAFIEIPSLGSGFGKVNIDLTPLLQKIKKEGKTNYGFLLKLNNEDPYSSLVFGSSSAQNEGLRPLLSILKAQPVVTPPVSLCSKTQPSGTQSVDAVICNRTDMVDLNFGNAENLQATGWTGNNVGSNDQDWRILFNFPLLDTLTGTNKVTLILYDSPSQYFNQEGNNASRIYLVTSSWEEAIVTWNTQPTYDPAIYIEVPKLGAGFDSVVVDLSSLVQKIKSLNRKNYGFLLKLNNEDPYSSLIFGSGDAINAAKRPKLTICKTPVVKPPAGLCSVYQPTGSESVDAIISNRSDMVDLNFANAANLQASGWTGYNVGSENQDWRILINFPLIDTLTGRNKVTLTLYDSPSQYFSQEGNNASRIYLVTSMWDENKVTWNTQPTFDPAAFVDIPALAPGFDSVVVDLSSLVQKIKADGKTNYGFLLKLNNEDPYSSLIFASGDAEDGDKRPKLSICKTEVIIPSVSPCTYLQPAGTESIDATISNRTDMVDLNFGNEGYLQASGWTGNNVGSNDQDWRILINFPILDTLTENKKITLTLFDAPSQYFQQEGTNASRIYAVTSKWEEGAVTWNTQPTYDATSYVDIPALANGFDSVVVDISPLAAKMRKAGKPNYGFLLKLDNEDPYSSLSFGSGDAANAALRPRLSVCREEVVVTPPKEKVVIIQPTGNESIDATVCNRSDMVDLNFGNDAYLQATGWTGNNVGSNNQDWRILIKFPAIDSLDYNYKVTMTLYDSPSQYFSQEGRNASRIYLLTQNWEEGTVTWNNQPGYDPSVYIEIPGLNPGFDSVVVDLFVLIQKMIRDDKPNFGFLLKLNNEDPYNSLIFGSGDAPIAALRPKLSIYSAPLVTNVSAVALAEEISFFPNPVSNEMVIRSNTNYNTFSIMDDQGKIVLSGFPENKINVSALTEGLYFIVLRSNEKTVSRKFIKE